MVSVDTMRAEVAEAALEAGRGDRQRRLRRSGRPARSSTWSPRPGAPYVAMHWRAHSDRMRDFATYDGPGGVVAAVCDELADRVEAIAGRRDRAATGSCSTRGSGFAKTAEPQLGAAARRSTGSPALGLPAAGRRLPQVLPRARCWPTRTASPRPVDEREHAHAAARSRCSPSRGVWGAAGARRARHAATRWRSSERLRRTGTTAGGRHDDRPSWPSPGIECFGHHGVFDFERRDGQIFVVDLVLGLDTRPAAASDDLRDTVDYGSLVAAVKAAVETDPVDLIETLAQRIADVCLLGRPC